MSGMDEIEPFAALNSGRSFDFWGNDAPKCPHCGHDLDIDRAERWDLYSGDDYHQVECPECEREYRVLTRASYSFSTDQQDDF